jgi:hypothetical protein
VATGRDLTGDGVDDLVVAAPFATTGDGPNSGFVFVFAGPVDQRTTLADAVGWFEGGELDGQPGGQLALAPDLTGDGLAELVIGYYRHTLIFSGAPPEGARRADAKADIELNTGGGAWHYASGPDRDGDGRLELLLGMDTYASGQGVVAEVRSGDPDRVATLTSNAAWPGLGAALANVDGVVWSLSGGTPVRLDTFEALSVSGTSLENGGDLDGDGHDDLLVGGATQFSAPLLGWSSLPGRLQGDRALMAATDVDGDGRADPRVLVDEEGAAVVAGGELTALCDADGDGVSAASGDCDDADPERLPMALEVCNGVDDDCDGAVDTLVQLPYAWPDGVTPAAVVLLGDDAAAVLGTDGVLTGTGEWDGTVVPGLSAIAFGGGTAEPATTSLLARATLADAVLPRGGFGTVDFVATAEIADGVGLVRAGAFGTVGDFDGDGTDELVTVAVDPVGHFVAAMFAGPVAGTQTLDEAAWIYNVPDGWSTLSVGLLDGPGVADVTADGRGDLLLGSSTSYYGQGRVLLISSSPAGVYEAETAALVNWYGEPEEALGASIAVGADLTGDGAADAVVAGEYGLRVIAGAACPVLGPGAEMPGGEMALVDLDADGVAEPLSIADGVLWWRGEAWHSADTLWAAGPFGAVATSGSDTWRTAGTCE